MLPSNNYWLKLNNGFENVNGDYRIICNGSESLVDGKVVATDELIKEIHKQNVYYNLHHDIPLEIIGGYIFQVFRKGDVRIIYNDEIWIEGKGRYLHIVRATSQAADVVIKCLSDKYTFI